MKNNLNQCKRVATAECFACRYAGIDATIWPQEVLDGTTGWKFFVNSTDRQALSSGNKRHFFCETHWHIMNHWWQDVAQYEVDLNELWHNYMDRIE